MGMTYEYHSWDLEDKARRNRYWAVLKEIRQHEYYEKYKGVYDLTSRPTIHYYVEEQYGFAMGINGSGDYTADYTITDPKKFLLFKIKFGL